MNRGVKWWFWVLFVGILLGCCSCGFPLGHEGGASPQDKRNSAFELYVRGELCVTADDGYTPPTELTPMAGMGVRFAGVPLPFEAKVHAEEPIGEGLRNFEVVYVSPPALCGVVVAGQVLRDNTGEGFCMAYTLSYPLEGGVLVLDVTYDQVAGLLSPLEEAVREG